MYDMKELLTIGIYATILFAQTNFFFADTIFKTQNIASFTNENKYAADFLEFWNDVKNNYAYFNNKQTDWDKVKSVYLPKAQNVTNRNELISLFENALEELYDNRFSLNTNLQSSTRLVPTGLDIWAEWINNKPVITEGKKRFLC